MSCKTTKSKPRNSKIINQAFEDIGTDASSDRSTDDNYQPADSPQDGESDSHLLEPPPPANVEPTASKSTKKKSHQPTIAPEPRPPTHDHLNLDNYLTVGQQLGRPLLEKMLNNPKRKTQN